MKEFMVALRNCEIVSNKITQSESVILEIKNKKKLFHFIIIDLKFLLGSLHRHLKKIVPQKLFLELLDMYSYIFLLQYFSILCTMKVILDTDLTW
jgi:hypothetical protein